MESSSKHHHWSIKPLIQNKGSVLNVFPENEFERFDDNEVDGIFKSLLT